MTRAISLLCSALMLLCFLTGCASQEPESTVQEPAVQTESVPPEAPAEEAGETVPEEQAEAPQLPPGAGLPESEFIGQDEPNQEEPAAQEPQPDPVSQNRGLIVIDPGHQAHPNSDTEPLGPGSSEMKMKVSGGTRGVTSGVPEYELDLTVSFQLQKELEARGYQVILTRESNDVNISNRERADIANSAGADVFLRIHADGSENPGTNGAMTLCPTANSPYPIGQLYPQCRLLADCVLDELVASTGAYRERVWETDTMSGLNWCQVPVTLVEMGYMTNPAEDAKLNDPAYQVLLVQGIANGVDRYFAQVGE